MLLMHAAMVVVGLVLTGFGLWAANLGTGAVQKWGALCAPAGMLLTILGALLLAVPGFFFPG
ncbi:MAG TPA: hypothetical protein PLG17_10545 [Thermodesulfobacteriota bacterium]|nr:hypothetical protein [Thermodesulfobacteriota bacterium]HNU72574.1 hypothetical protein [Thermodesulfobacteriota bacterium]HQO78935.1 hypothetical protein [Thermodesulfobacteriota bacterium]